MLHHNSACFTPTSNCYVMTTKYQPALLPTNHHFRTTGEHQQPSVYIRIFGVHPIALVSNMSV
jgi:hypothetical protein